MTPPLASRWLLGARPRTLPAAVVPVVVGTAVAGADGPLIWWRAGAALVVAMALQVATNYANDYSDGVRGTDAARSGPRRLVGSGLASPAAVRRAALIAFAVAAVVGVVLSVAVEPWLIAVVGVPSIAAAWYYTGGKRPYGYAGFGELFVFVFFGLVATCGAQYVQSESVSATGVLAGTAVGLLAVALLVVNNLRDIEEDARSGKRTLAVRLGESATRRLYSFCVAVPFVITAVLAVERSGVLLVFVAVALVIKPVQVVLHGAKGRDLVAVLGATGSFQLAFGVLFALGMSL